MAWAASAIRCAITRCARQSTRADIAYCGSVKNGGVFLIGSGLAHGQTERLGRSSIGVIGKAIVLTVGTLLPIMNPFSTIPLFLSLTAGMDPVRRNREARMACIYALALLVGFLLLGEAIIDFFGISVPGIRVSGGVIISAIGARMLFSAPPATNTEQEKGDIAFTPLAMPSLAGPGSLSVVITAASQINARNPQDYEIVYLGVIIGLVMVVAIAFLFLRAAGSLARFLGPSGLDAMTRIFGFLLIAIGMQFLLTGISDFYGLAGA